MIRKSKETEESTVVIPETTPETTPVAEEETGVKKEEKTGMNVKGLGAIVLAAILGVAGIAVYKKHGRGKEDDYVSEQLEFSDGPYVNEEEDEEEEEEDDEDMNMSHPSRNAGQGAASSAQTASKKSSNDTPVLDNFGTDMTRAAEEGKLDPVVGREREIERLAQILSRRKKNNPVLIGEPGVGKSAIVEGLALRIVQKKVSRILFDKRVVMLDMASVVAGTKYRGQFEERIRSIINELQKNPNVILFIDAAKYNVSVLPRLTNTERILRKTVLWSVVFRKL